MCVSNYNRYITNTFLFFHRKRKFQNEGKIPQFMEGISKITPVMESSVVEYVQKEAQYMCKWKR